MISIDYNNNKYIYIVCVYIYFNDVKVEHYNNIFNNSTIF